jgi:hypothetical protein
MLQKLSVLVVEANCYYHDYIDRLHDGLSPEPEVTEAEMFVFLALTIQLGHGLRNKLTDYWSTKDQLYTPFFDTLMKRDHTFTSLVTYILLTTGMNLIGWTEILTAALWPWS